ncbi:MAG: formate dehydrogenase accessory sulfurtransferase FdhD [Tetrasphaera sp.]|nr:formate dehydrogenase accessory sulfurtransferase FdhD [Tetrasphaera sp.]
MGRVTVRVPVERIRTLDGQTERSRRPDVLAVEEPLEIRAGGQVVTVTMRTPGADIDLVHGYLLAEGIITAADQVRGARYCAGAVATGPDGVEQNTYNVIDVHLDDPARIPLGLSRTSVSTSACGVCGSASIEAIAERLARSGYAVPPTLAATAHPTSPATTTGAAAIRETPVSETSRSDTSRSDAFRSDTSRSDTSRSAVTISAGVIAELVAALRTRQAVFERTGGLHAAALADTGGTIHAHAEDVGRHNAVDKVVGAGLRAHVLPRPDAVLVVSSRASFEIVQKAAMARIPIVIVVSAPSSLAVETAAALGLTLIAFARDERCNIYSGFERVVG